MRSALHILLNKQFWRDFKAYWSMNALAKRINTWVEERK